MKSVPMLTAPQKAIAMMVILVLGLYLSGFVVFFNAAAGVILYFKKIDECHGRRLVFY